MRVLASLGSCFSSRKLPQYAAAIIANLMTISYGLVAGWSSPSLQLLKNEETAIGEPISDQQETWLGSLIHLSAFLASPMYSYINQNWGRKIAGYLSAAPLIIGWLLIIFADSIMYLYIARFLMGLSMCGVNVFIVMYIGEISEDGIRGTLGTLRGVGADLGILIIYGLAPYLSIQNMAIISISLPLLFLILYFWLPESPMFLLSKGRTLEARNAFLWLRGGDADLAEEEVKKMNVVVEVISRKVSLKELLSVRGTRNALLIAVVFALVIQFSGMYVICSYAARLFDLSGSTMPSDIASIVIAAITIVGSLLALVGTDIAGRRIILISSQIVEGLSLGGLGVYLFAKHLQIDVTSVGILPVIFISLYCLCIAAGVATLAYVVVAEIFRPEARGLAMSVMSTVVWGLAFVTTKFHHDLETVIGLHGCFLVYCAITLAGALFTYIRVPETKNRSLESILRELNGDPPLKGANLISVSYGVIQGWGSPSLLILRSNNTSLEEPITDEQESWLGSVPHLAALLASPLYSYINQNLGRKTAGYLTAAPLVIAWLIIIFATSITYFYISRILMGLTLVGVNVFINMYTGEISEDGIRGTLGCMRGVAADLGILFIYCLGPYLSISTMSVVSITLPILFIVLFYWLPESPMFLLTKGEHVEAMNAYIWLRGGDIQNAEEEIQKLNTVVKSTAEKTNLIQMLKIRGTRKALVIAVVFVVVAQLSGINVVFSYTSRILQMSGSTLSPDIATIIVGIVNFCGSFAALFGVDLAGRRFIMISTQFFQGISLGGLGVYLYMKELGFDVSSAGVLPVISISLYCFSVVAGVGTVGYVVLAETFRPEARGLATSVTSIITWALAFISTRFHYVLETVIGSYGCFCLYAGVSIAGTIFTYLQLPETKNRSLDSILRELNGDQQTEIIQNSVNETRRQVQTVSVIPEPGTSFDTSSFHEVTTNGHLEHPPNRTG